MNYSFISGQTSEAEPLETVSQTVPSKEPDHFANEDAVGYEAIKLKRSKWSTILDLLQILAPLAFLGLAAAAKILNGTPKSIQGDRVRQGLLITPTLFPMVFAALCGHMMKSLAMYRSQRGMELRHLEHLVGAQTMFGALEKAIVLGSFGGLGIAVITLWILSPIGGQAFLRLLDTEPYNITSPYDLSYQGPDLVEGYSFTYTGEAVFTQVPGTMVYYSSLAAPENIRESPRDIWGNPKVPWIGALSRDLRGGGEWLSTGGIHRYNNLAGVPIGHTTLGTNTTSSFTIMASTLNVSCSSLELTALDDIPQQVDKPISGFWGPGGTLPNGTTTVEFQKGLRQEGYPTTFLYITNDTYTEYQQTKKMSPIKIYYGSHSGRPLDPANPYDDIPVSLATCIVAPIILDMNLTCTGQSCAVDAVRQSDNVPEADIRDVLTDGNFCGMSMSEQSGVSWPTEQFITDPDKREFVGGFSSDYVDLSSVPLEDFEYRFSQALNTFWYASTSTYIDTGIGNMTEADSGTGQEDFRTVSGQSTTYLGLRYKCHMVWLSVAILITFVLELVALTNLALRWRTYVPDQFGYVSSLTIMNPYCQAQRKLWGSTALDGNERAKRFGHVKFRMVDVGVSIPDGGGYDGGDTGQVAFVPVSSNGDGTGRMDWEAAYRDVRYGREYY